MEDLTLAIQGMSCGHCVQSITTLLAKLDGVKTDQVSIGEAMLGYDPRRITPEQIIQAVEEAGYTAQLRKETV
jgi:copper chaperone CopZ